MSSFDVAVIGAGMLGAAAAYRLASAGQRVVVLEAHEPAAGASGSSFAWLNAVSKEPEAYHRLNADGMAEYQGLEEELGDEFGLHGGGALQWSDDPAQQAMIEERVRRLAGRGYPAVWIDCAEAQRLEPGLAIQPDTAGVAYYPGDAWVDAPRLVRAFLNRSLAEGAEVWRGAPVLGLQREGTHITTIQTSRGPLSTENVLLCAGTATSDLLAPLDVTLPVDRVPGLTAVTSPLAEHPSRVVYAPGVHLRPDVSGGLLLGADDVDALTTEDTPSGPPPDYAQVLLERARRAVPAAANARIESVRIGVRPIPADGHTVAGPVPGLSNAWVLVTHSGITIGPLLGRLIAEEITGGAPDGRLADFRPDRLFQEK